MQFDAYIQKQREKGLLEEELERWKEKNHNLTEQIEVADTDERKQKLMVELGRDLELEGKIGGLDRWCEKRRELAKERGKSAKFRAEEAGRTWREGDGF
jgi:hypothetical protein